MRQRAKLFGLILVTLAVLTAVGIANAQDGPTLDKPVVAVQVNTAIELSWPAVSGAEKLPPPPSSVESDKDFQLQTDYHDTDFVKYTKAPGVHVVAPSDMPDLMVEQAAEIIAGMLSDRPELAEDMDGHNSIAFLLLGVGHSGSGGLEKIRVTSTNTDCELLMHEMAHMIHATIEGKTPAINDPPSGTAFDSELRTLYQAAIDTGLWANTYAARNFIEYWAEATRYWFVDQAPGQNSGLDDYDPGIAALIEETLGDASVPAYCHH